ncbi:universal stress protein [Weeksellaceae bacterium KMM 9713]|uniref:Universal stress protein n=1 Tax=Profundicola chukchiensis TaxID=2961959 RepID=A0A9X4N2Q8_9FLAO|nr:universal stress protein [Profundicola chukchiensis]MDG4945789.1 universal stress protein [Profundicola chukchiensis]MDG4951526.1 universal stress protein [Profundicola chukchiensis]
MKTILVPVDLSPFSHEIAMEAVKVAKISGGKLILLHVVSLDIGFIIGDVGFQYLPELEKTALEEDAKELTKLQEIVAAEGVEVESMVKQGIPVDTILEQADEVNADAMVIGSKGHGTLYEAFVGSVCRDVIKDAKIPIVVIPNQKKKK